MSIDEMIEVLQAAREGKRIQLRRRNNVAHDPCKGEWHDCYAAEWNFSAFDYRVSTQPRECWVPKELLSRDASEFPVPGWIKVREVLE